MTLEDRACLALDLGEATSSAALLGRIDGRWRLLGTMAMPSVVPAETIAATLAARLVAADPGLAGSLGADRAVSAWPRLVVRTGPTPRLAVLAATGRTLGRLTDAARRSGWAVLGASAETDDPLEMTRVVLRSDVSAVLVGAADPPATDERSVIADLAELVAAAAVRRPELTVILSGSLADEASRFERPATADHGIGGEEEPGPSAAPQHPVAEMGSQADATDGIVAADGVVAADGLRSGNGAGIRARAGPRPEATDDPARARPREGPTDRGPAGTLILAPAPAAGDPPGEALRRLLDDLRTPADDSRRAMVRATASLAGRLDRRVETVEIGYGGGLRVVARPARGPGHADVRWVVAAEAALVPGPVDDDVVDGVLAWSTLALDRHRLRDRLAELRLSPWAEAHGDGAPLRLAAARAALSRLVARSHELDRPAPDLVVAAGGAWAVAPGAAVGLALADVVRRPGAYQLALDHARLLGPLGAIPEEPARDAMIGDLLDDALAPLGSVVIPAGLRAGRSAGRLVVHATSGTTELDLVPGGLELVDLPPGDAAVAEFRFRDAVTLGTRGRRFAIDVGGGLGGLLVDLRDIPLHLPDRAERRRELLDAWQRALWAGVG